MRCRSLIEPLGLGPGRGTSDKLPNMDFAINEKAEPRVLVPWEQTTFANLTSISTSVYKRPGLATSLMTSHLLPASDRGYRERPRRRLQA